MSSSTEKFGQMLVFCGEYGMATPNTLFKNSWPHQIRFLSLLQALGFWGFFLLHQSILLYRYIVSHGCYSTNTCNHIGKYVLNEASLMQSNDPYCLPSSLALYVGSQLLRGQSLSTTDLNDNQMDRGVFNLTH